MTEPLSSRFPEPLDNDDDDVAWALQTAKVMWQRGAEADAIVWLRRGADTADSQGNVWRAAELRRAAEALGNGIAGSRPPFPRPPPVPLSSPGEIDALLRVSAPSRPPSPPPSFTPLDNSEFEERAELSSFDEIVVEGHEARLGQISVIDDGEVIEEPDELDEDAFDGTERLPAFALEPGTSSGSGSGSTHYMDADDPVTQPHHGDPLGGFPGLRRQQNSVPEPEPEPEPEEEDPRVGDLVLGEVRGLEDLPPEAQTALVREVLIETLGAQEEVGSFGLALVLKGAVSIMPAIADLTCARAARGDIIWAQGNLEEGVALRLVASQSATEVALWDARLIKAAVRDCPWVIDDLKALADRFQALAGVAMGPMGERLDDSLRALVTARCEIKRLLPGELFATRGKPVGGMYIVAAGRIEIVDGAAIESELGPGDFVFVPQMLSNGAAPRDARAGTGGALVLFAKRSVAHELLLSVPPLLEIFAR